MWTCDMLVLIRLIAITKYSGEIPPLSALTVLLVASAHMLHATGRQNLGVQYREFSVAVKHAAHRLHV